MPAMEHVFAGFSAEDLYTIGFLIAAFAVTAVMIAVFRRILKGGSAEELRLKDVPPGPPGLTEPILPTGQAEELLHDELKRDASPLIAIGVPAGDVPADLAARERGGLAPDSTVPVHRQDEIQR